MNLLIAAVVLAIIAAMWVAHPILFRRWRMVSDPIPTATLEREARKRVALAALKDVEYDHAAGKLDEVDYEEMRSRLEAEALEALKAADAPRADDRPRRHTCGFVNPPGSRFCAGCGRRLT